MKLIVGLGNPGKQYEKTRHNIGWLVLDKLNKKYRLTQTNNKKLKADIAQTNIGEQKIILVKPQTYMNESGVSVRAIMDYYKINIADLIVVHDDKDIDLGKIKIQTNRSAAGHNGVKSIIDHLHSQDFIRIRMGVASKNKKKMSDTAKFVLAKFGLLEKTQLKKSLDEALAKIEELISS